MNHDGLEQAEIQIKYNGYIQREKETVLKLNKLEGIRIPNFFDYSKLNAISSESREKLNNIKPETIGQASRISGVSPSDINILLVFMGRWLKNLFSHKPKTTKTALNIIVPRETFC